MARTPSLAILPTVACGIALSCNALTGVGDLQVQSGSGATSGHGGASSTGGAGTGATGTTGGTGTTSSTGTGGTGTTTSSTTSTSSTSSGTGGTGTTGSTTTTSATSTVTWGTGGTSTGPACGSLADGVRVTSITVAAGGWGRAITAERGAGSIVAYGGSDGFVHVLPLDANDAVMGAEIATEGSAVFGAAAKPNDVALLVSRPPDYMTFVRLNEGGSKLSSIDLVGGGDHLVVGVEWFGEFAQTGRLVTQADGSYAAYHALHRRWPDGIGHQGDTLRFLGADGSEAGAGWGWGCSHSMDQRLARGPTGLVPICIADCYPGKGIYFNHNGPQITDDPGANCAGGYTTLLGGLVAVADGFFLVYQDAQGGAHLGHYDGWGQPISSRALTEPGSSRLAAYEDGLLIGSPGGSGSRIEKLDAAGDPTGETADVAASLPDQDFEGRSDGEVAWATVSGSTLTVVRVRKCP